MRSNPIALETPERFARYVLFHELARGGMGTVYLARARSSLRGFRRIVALKRLHPHLASDERFRRMFLDEVRLIAQLSHPNTCTAVDFGESEGMLWLAMPFLLGDPVDRVMSAVHSTPGPFRAQWPTLTAHILIDACEGLHAAHELRDELDRPLQVVHRDVTPRNVIIGYDGVTRVIDFGIASAVQRLQHTMAGELKGTAAYAAPEHIEGRPVDRRADVWSLGVLGWEMCTGKELFAGSEASAILHKVLNAPIPGAREANPEVPLGLDEILAKALNRDPDRRYATAREMGRDLLLFLGEEGVTLGASHVAECMDAIFPGEHAERRRMLAQVQTREVKGLPSSSKPRPATRAIELALAAALGGITSVALWRVLE